MVVSMADLKSVLRLFASYYDDPVDRKPRKGLRVCHGKRPS